MNLEKVTVVLGEAVPGLIAVYLFGSAASGDGRAESDVDLAVLADARLSALARWELQEKLASELGRDVDLVDLRQASDVLKMQVVSRGRVLYERPGSERAAFEALAFSAYARLNDERQGILDDVRARGSVYG